MLIIQTCTGTYVLGNKLARVRVEILIDDKLELPEKTKTE